MHIREPGTGTGYCAPVSLGHSLSVVKNLLPLSPDGCYVSG
jgi:hypothetical protein